jgi:hypothetical protein
VRASPFRGLVASQANTSPTGANRKEEMNKVKLEGRLTKDPELNVRGDRKVCDLRLAVNGPGNTPPLFIDVVAFELIELAVGPRSHRWRLLRPCRQV